MNLSISQEVIKTPKIIKSINWTLFTKLSQIEINKEIIKILFKMNFIEKRFEDSKIIIINNPSPEFAFAVPVMEMTIQKR